MFAHVLVFIIILMFSVTLYSQDITYSEADIEKAKKITETVLEYELKGCLLGGEKRVFKDELDSVLEDVKIHGLLSGPDMLSIVTDCKIVSSSVTDNSILVQVQYKVLATIISFPQIIEQDTVRIETYRLRKENEKFHIWLNERIIVSKETALSDMENWLKQQPGNKRIQEVINTIKKLK